MDLDFRMRAERTPNPNSVKWVLSRVLLDDGRSAQFDHPPSPEISPLAARLFAVRGVEGVLIAHNFVTVTKGAQGDWPDLAQSIVDAIKAFVSSGEPTLGPAWEPPVLEAGQGVESRIRSILDQEIRPYVARDGGDVIFAGFRDGVVELVLQGACSGCPASTATLKLGIESRLREMVPEVREVVAL